MTNHSHLDLGIMDLAYNDDWVREWALLLSGLTRISLVPIQRRFDPQPGHGKLQLCFIYFL